MKLGLRRHGDTHHPRKGSDPLTWLGTAPRTIWGSVDDLGAILEDGSGDWTTDTGGNPYVISFDDYPTNPIAVATLRSDQSSTNATIEIDARTTGSVTFHVFDSAGADETGGFDFIIIGAI